MLPHDISGGSVKEPKFDQLGQWQFPGALITQQLLNVFMQKIKKHHLTNQ